MMYVYIRFLVVTYTQTISTNFNNQEEVLDLKARKKS